LGYSDGARSSTAAATVDEEKFSRFGAERLISLLKRLGFL
jgi:hypothetical protein